jgi:predicted phosphodiesterase
MKKYLKKPWLILMLTIFIVIGGFFGFLSEFGGNPKHKNSANAKWNDLYSTTASYLSVETQYRYLSVYDWFTGFNRSIKIGWISDIHADRFKRRQVESGLLYPRQYSDYLLKVFDALRKQGINTVISTGDNVNSGDDGYAKDLVRIAREKDMHMIWTKGNHDTIHSMTALGVTGKKYFYVDYLNTRIIVLDDTVGMEQTGNYDGSIDLEQVNWLSATLKTNKPVIVAMHIPIFQMHTGKDTIVIEKYTALERILRDSGNVKMIISGHWHIPWQKQYDGLNFYGEGALTREGMKGDYAIINLNTYSVDYKTVDQSYNQPLYPN